jgi:hypothetical protein
MFKTYFGPTNRTFAVVGTAKHPALTSDILDVLGRMNRGGKASLIVPGDYLEIAITKH